MSEQELEQSANRGARSRRQPDVREVVAVVPGFLGFSRFGGFYYFADRVAAALRACLDPQQGRRVPGVPVTTMPAGSLASRQRGLIEQLGRLTEPFPNLERLHLVGHSTGGLDAELLLEDAPFPEANANGERGSWSSEAERIRERLASVVTIAAPLWGTCLADSELAAFFESPTRHPSGLPTATRTMAELLLGIFRKPVAAEFTAGVSQALPDALRFIGQIIKHRELIEDLKPARLLQHRRGGNRLEVPLRSFVTIAFDPAAGSALPDDLRPERFFTSVYELTATASSSETEAQLLRALRLLEAHAQGAIREPGAPAPEFTVRANDGMVNSGLQLLDADQPEQLAGIVLADHADVIGHYDRIDALVDGQTLNRGLFHSGCGFGDDAFFLLWESVAREISTRAARKTRHQAATRAHGREEAVGQEAAQRP